MSSAGTDATGDANGEGITSPGADAELAIGQVTGWIIGADTKAGLLAALLGVFAGGFGTQVSQLRDALPPDSVRDWVLLLLSHLVVLSLAAAVWFVQGTLVPRATVGLPTRFAWPVLADADPKSYAAVAPGQVRAEAWQHAVDLAGIARLKYAAFRRALSCAVVAGVGLLGLLLVTAWS
ncbi:hypothetical protein [Streptomyces phaeochromogenes]|uniref:hypothetical protein n=1 Tax=Streptomyces phaeochromogenes TaxID=1923 RepID=UPI0036B0D18A